MFLPSNFDIILSSYRKLCRWSQIAAHLPGRTDNEIKNFWNTRVRKKLLQKGIDPETHKPIPTSHIPNNLLLGLAIAQSLGGPNDNNLGSSAINPWEIITCTELAKILLVHNLIQSMGTNNPIVDQSAHDTLLQPCSNSESRNITPGANPNMINLHWPMEYPWASSGSGDWSFLVLMSCRCFCGWFPHLPKCIVDALKYARYVKIIKEGTKHRQLYVHYLHKLLSFILLFHSFDCSCPRQEMQNFHQNGHRAAKRAPRAPHQLVDSRRSQMPPWMCLRTWTNSWKMILALPSWEISWRNN